MKKSHLYGAVCACVFSLISIPSHAALVDIGGGLIYDTVLDITWAQPDIVRNWDDANTWAAGLTLGGVNGWRLPYLSVQAGAGPTDAGFNPIDCSAASEEACRDNELGYMFYQNLSGTKGQSILNSGDPDLALFASAPGINIFTPTWTGTEGQSDRAWSFEFGDGGQAARTQIELNATWAVHDGNVGLPTGPVDLSGAVEDAGGTPLCLSLIHI